MTSRRQFLVTGGLSAVAALAPRARGAESPPNDGRAAAPRPLWIDGLGVPGGVDFEKGIADLTSAQMLDLQASSLAAINVTVGITGNATDVFERSLFSIAHWERQILAHPTQLLKIRSSSDLERARRHNAVGLIFGFQDASPIGSDIGRLGLFHTLGVRVIQLTYNQRNLCGDGCLEPTDGGVSRFGQAVIDEVARLGLLLDLSHASPRTIEQSIAHHRKPCVISHSACRDLVDRPRNTYDRHMRLLAEKGGVFGIYLMPFLRASGQPDGADFIRHVEHAIDVCGEDHVSVGTDGFVSPTAITDAYRTWHRAFVEDRRKRAVITPGESEDVLNLIPEFNRVDRFAVIADRLRSRGHPAARIDKLLGRNLARVMGEVWG